MKTKYYLFAVLACFILLQKATAATFIQGEDNTIATPIHDNLYIAGVRIIIDNKIYGDLVAAGTQVSINDTIFEDVIIAGGDILINNYLANDAKIAGETIKILKNIHGDLVVCGASITIHKDVIINGDLIIIGGQIIMNGTVNGNVKAMGGDITINGNIKGILDVKADKITLGGMMMGASTISANQILLTDGVAFQNNIRYWQKEGSINFEPYLTGGTAFFDEDLDYFDEQKAWKFMGFGILSLGILYLLSIILVIFLMIQFLPRVFKRAAEQLRLSPMRNFGYGILYLFGIPLLSLLMMLTIIGIPVGVLLLHLYIISLLFSISLTSVLLTFSMNLKYEKEWGKGKMLLVACLLFVALKIITMIPIIGSFIGFVLVSISFGTMVLACKCWLKKEE